MAWGPKFVWCNLYSICKIMYKFVTVSLSGFQLQFLSHRETKTHSKPSITPKMELFVMSFCQWQTLFVNTHVCVINTTVSFTTLLKPRQRMLMEETKAHFEQTTLVQTIHSSVKKISLCDILLSILRGHHTQALLCFDGCLPTLFITMSEYK